MLKTQMVRSALVLLVAGAAMCLAADDAQAQCYSRRPGGGGVRISVGFGSPAFAYPRGYYSHAPSFYARNYVRMAPRVSYYNPGIYRQSYYAPRRCYSGYWGY